MKIEVNNRQKLCHPDIPRIKKLIQYFMLQDAKRTPKDIWDDVSIVLTDDKGISTLNEQYLGHKGSTDVLSFRYDPVPGDSQMLSGEVIVNVQRALKWARKIHQRWNASKELSLYLAHGCDHLMGENDNNKAGYRRMRRRELRWLKQTAMTLKSGKLLR
jgi:rRNA maturation RNase YbeY